MKKILREPPKEGETISFNLPTPMKKKCAECPFTLGGNMRKSLGKERVEEIESHVIAGGFFPCHKTTEASLGEEKFVGWLPKPLQYRECAGGVKVEERKCRIVWT